MKILRTCIDSIFAGVMIAIGAAVYLNCPNRIVGAVLFSIGLITIMEFDFNLYTGRVGFVKKWREIPRLILVFIMNAIGCFLIMPISEANTLELWSQKIAQPLYIVFFKAVICGILIYVCVHQHKHHSTLTSCITTLIAIPAFILCGAEHSIADICFMLATKHITLEGVWFIFVVALGNAVGSLMIGIWTSKRSELYQNYKDRHC